MARPHLVHCSYHKCLTVYFGRVMRAVFNKCLFWSSGYRHYNSHERDFLDGLHRHRIVSINNRALDLDRLGDFRLSRFIRDPRDLVVSGYFYHRRGAEEWVRTPEPTPEDFYFANGVVPEGMIGSGASFAGYLASLPEEEGLLAELEFRQRHFASMADWPEDHPAILTFRYEDIVGDEERVFRDLFDFYGLSAVETWLGSFFARRYAFGNRGADAHVRDPRSGQWREHFTARVRDLFDERYGELLQQLGYPPD